MKYLLSSFEEVLASLVSVLNGLWVGGEGEDGDSVNSPPSPPTPAATTSIADSKDG